MSRATPSKLQVVAVSHSVLISETLLAESALCPRFL